MTRDRPSRFPVVRRAKAGGAIALAVSLCAAAAHAEQFFDLATTGAPAGVNGAPENPLVRVGFNPQPDPPGAPATILDLGNPFAPALINPTVGAEFTFLLDIKGFGDAVIPLPAAPNADGVFGFSQTLNGHVLDGRFIIGGGPIAPGSWSSFNPQPDPPGDVLGIDVQFAADPRISFSLNLDGQPLSFAAVPEPSTWLLGLVGVAGVGAALRRRRLPMAVTA